MQAPTRNTRRATVAKASRERRNPVATYRANVAKASRERRKPVAPCRAYVAKSARDRRKGIARHTGNALLGHHNHAVSRDNAWALPYCGITRNLAVRV